MRSGILYLPTMIRKMNSSGSGFLSACQEGRFNYPGSNRHIIEYDLYKILIDIVENRKILSQIPDMEAKKGRERLLEALVNVANTEAYVARMDYQQPPGMWFS